MPHHHDGNRGFCQALIRFTGKKPEADAAFSTRNAPTEAIASLFKWRVGTPFHSDGNRTHVSPLTGERPDQLDDRNYLKEQKNIPR